MSKISKKTKSEKSNCDYGKTATDDIVRSCCPPNTTDKVGGRLFRI